MKTSPLSSPYNLKAGYANSNAFYERLELLTQRILKKGSYEMQLLLKDYRRRRFSNQPWQETLLDIIMLGVLGNLYAGKQIPLLSIKHTILKKLYQIRKHHPKLKKHTDRLRGRLACHWLAGSNNRFPAYPTTLKELDSMLLFLSATNEYNEEIKRFRPVLRFLKEKNAGQLHQSLNSIMQLGRWFISEAKEHLGSFTSSVAPFLEAHPAGYAGREDFFFCGRQEAEYHLNMVGAQIINRVQRAEFLQTRQRVLLVPTCMASGPHCCATQKGSDLVCAHCTPSCRISELTRQMENNGLKTVLIRHSSKFSSWLKPWANQNHTGLIGTACVLNLLMGGFEMKRLNIPSQCVFLDHCSCQKHWKSTKPTDINAQQICKTNQMAVRAETACTKSYPEEVS